MIFTLKNILTFIECVLNKDFCQKISRDNSYAKWTFCLLCRVFMINEFHMYLFLNVFFFLSVGYFSKPCLLAIWQLDAEYYR